MRIEDIKPAVGSTKEKKRVGRGFGSGLGKTSGKGHKGQKARSGGPKGAGFEGGQMPLQRRVPKRGFTNNFATEYAVVNLDVIERLRAEGTVTPDMLVGKGIIKDMKCGLKVLGNGTLNGPVNVKATAFSASAAAKIEAAGGKAEVL
jgi:large subunit ribosomal protein L15